MTPAEKARARLERARDRRARRACRPGSSAYAHTNATDEAEADRCVLQQQQLERRHGLKALQRYAAERGKVYVPGWGEVDVPEGVSRAEFQRTVDEKRMAARRTR